jgi:hypothetical protein
MIQGVAGLGIADVVAREANEVNMQVDQQEIAQSPAGTNNSTFRAHHTTIPC